MGPVGSVLEGHPAPESEERPTMCRTTIRVLRSDLFWATREIEDLHKGTKLNLSRRRRRSVLQRRLGHGKGCGLGRAGLSRIRERIRGLLHIRLAKERGKRNREARKRAQKVFAK